MICEQILNKSHHIFFYQNFTNFYLYRPCTMIIFACLYTKTCFFFIIVLKTFNNSIGLHKIINIVSLNVHTKKVFYWSQNNLYLFPPSHHMYTIQVFFIHPSSGFSRLSKHVHKNKCVSIIYQDLCISKMN